MPTLLSQLCVRSPPRRSRSPPGSACSRSPSTTASSSSARRAARSAYCASHHAGRSALVGLAAGAPVPGHRRAVGDPRRSGLACRHCSASTSRRTTISHPLVLGPVFTGILGARADLAEHRPARLRAAGDTDCARHPRAQRAHVTGPAGAGVGHGQRRRALRRAVPALGILQPDAGDPARPARLPHTAEGDWRPE